MSRVAIIVVHGVGTQGRYQTLDKFVRGFVGAVAHRTPKVETDGISLAQGAQNFVSICAEDGAPLMANPPANQVDCYEAYWQSEVRGLARVRGVATWAVNTMLAPARLWAQVDVHQRSVLGRINRIIAEFLRLLVFPLIILGAAVAFIGGAAWYSFIRAEAADVQFELGPTTMASLEVALLFVALLLLRGGVWKGLLRSELARNIDRGIGASKTERWWGTASALLLTLVVTGLAASFLSNDGLVLWRGELQPVIIMGAATIALMRVSSLFTEIAGDAAIYLTDDPDSKGTKTRRQIRATVEDLVLELGNDSRYSRIHVVAHSLGTVIAYDTLNRLRMISESKADHSVTVADRAMRRRSERAYHKIGTFFTLASPLDMVAYYFRTRVPSDRSVRRDILHFRHGLRVRPSDARVEAGKATAEPAYIDGPEDFYWYNIHAKGDPIGEELNTYKTDRQVRVGSNMGYLRFVTAHEGMWKNRDVYAHIASRLAGPAPAQVEITEPASATDEAVHA